MQDALGRVRGFVIVFLKQGTPNIVWSNCKRVLLFSINNGMTPLNMAKTKGTNVYLHLQFLKKKVYRGSNSRYFYGTLTEIT